MKIKLLQLSRKLLLNAINRCLHLCNGYSNGTHLHQNLKSIYFHFIFLSFSKMADDLDDEKVRKMRLFFITF